VRVPTHIVSSICDDRGEEPTYAGITMSTLMEGDFCVGDVISLLWCVTAPVFHAVSGQSTIKMLERFLHNKMGQVSTLMGGF